MARVLLLVPTRTYRTADFMSAARSLGIEVAIGSEQRSALAGLMCDRMLSVTFEHMDRAVAASARFAARHPLDAIVAGAPTCTLRDAPAPAGRSRAGNTARPVPHCRHYWPGP